MSLRGWWTGERDETVVIVVVDIELEAGVPLMSMNRIG